MRNLIVTAALLVSSQLMAQGPVVVVDAPLDHLFIPQGFDNNDNVEVVVTGKYPNPCYTRNKVEIDVKGDLVNIQVTSLMQEDQNRKLCEDMKVPFSEVVTIGSLQAGDYKVVVNDQLTGKLDVSVTSSNSVDDHLYAQVDYVELGFTGGLSGDAMLVGSSVSPCLILDKVEYLDNGADTYSVLPIMKKINNECPEKRTRIAIPIKFDPNKLKNSQILLFVRSIDGKSVHSIIDKL